MSTPVNAGPLRYSKAPVGSILSRPFEGPDTTSKVRTWPGCGSEAVAVPRMDAPVTPCTAVSSAVGPVFGRTTGTTTVLARLDSDVPSLFSGSGSGVVEVALAMSVSVVSGAAAAVPVTVSVWLEPAARVPSVQVTVVAPTTPPADALTPTSPGGRASVTTTSSADAGPLLATEIAYVSTEFSATVAGPVLPTTTSADGRGSAHSGAG